MFKIKVKDFIKPEKLDHISLGFYIFLIRNKSGPIRDHALLAQLIKERFKVEVSKADIDNYYGFNNVVSECYEDESRKQFYKLQL